MKIFVSGQIGDVSCVRSVQQQLVDAGHEITHDWTRNETGDALLAGRQAKLDNQQEAANRAVLDINGVLDADAYVICTDNEKQGKGMYVELGAAIALAENNQSLKIFLLGNMEHMTIFYFHPQANVVSGVDEIIKQLA